MSDKIMLSRFSVWPNGDSYTLTVEGADGASLELGATPEQLDEIIKSLDERLRTDDSRPPAVLPRIGAPRMQPANMALAEALQNVVDTGELSEGSREYMVAQKVVREGEDVLTPEEQQLWREVIIHHLPPPEETGPH